MTSWRLLVVALLAAALFPLDAYGQQPHLATDEAAFDSAQAAAAPSIRVTGLSSVLRQSAATSEDASVEWQSSATAELSAGSRAQFKLWCLGLFLGGAAVYWAGDQAEIEFVASTGAFVAVVGLLGLIMPTW